MSIDRRSFLSFTAATPLLAREPASTPVYKIVTPYPKGDASVGMPGPYRGEVVQVDCPDGIDVASNTVDQKAVGAALDAGMRSLTGEASVRDAWARFFTPSDVVGIKVNCSGAPNIMSAPEVVSEIARNLVAVGVPAKNIWVYERFASQMKTVGYEKYLPEGAHVQAAETNRGSILGYDPRVYVETDFFGEEDTRSNLTRLVSETFTKIINVPNMKEHQASGITGCLKNIAYGDFSNVARSHRYEKTNTYSFIGTLASVKPLRSRTVLHIMDGLRGVWHAGPFSVYPQFRFYPRQFMLGTDPVAMDRLLIDIIDGKRKQEGAPSVFDRSPERIKAWKDPDPGVNRFIREPGHVEYSAGLGLGVFDIDQIRVRRISA